jgi:hypothetical protein
MNLPGWLVTGLVLACPGQASQTLEGTFKGDICKVEGKLPGNLRVRVVVAMGPARRPTADEMKAMNRERFKEYRAPDSRIRPVTTFQLAIDGQDVAIPPGTLDDLHDTDKVKVWNAGQAVYCMIQGSDGVGGYQATFGYSRGRDGWVQAMKAFKRKGKAKVETRKVEVDDSFETEGVE